MARGKKPWPGCRSPRSGWLAIPPPPASAGACICAASPCGMASTDEGMPAGMETASAYPMGSTGPALSPWDALALEGSLALPRPVDLALALLLALGVGLGLGLGFA